MGYHHCHIPSLKDLEKQLLKIGLEKFVGIYKRCHTFIGDTDAVLFIESKISEYIKLSETK